MPDDNGLTDPTHEKNAWWQLNCFYRWSYQIRETMLSHLKIYAYMRRWDCSVKMRMLMRQCGVSRTFPAVAGLTLEIGDRVHEFHDGDNLHHYSVSIYQLLNEEMKREGYIPIIGCIWSRKSWNLGLKNIVLKKYIEVICFFIFCISFFIS